jgi:hypothetical protein
METMELVRGRDQKSKKNKNSVGGASKATPESLSQAKAAALTQSSFSVHLYAICFHNWMSLEQRSVMRRKLFLLVVLGSLLCVAACSKKAAFVSYSKAVPKAMGMAFAGNAGGSQQGRFIAESHSLEVISAESELQKSWESLIAFCAAIQCEVLSSNITTRSADSPPSGTVSLRVVPDDLSKLLAQVDKLGKITQHSTTREDKTVEVTDTDAKIKNLTSFRDNLRAMLSKPSATVKDLIDIQQQLTETQSQLDSETAQRKILANLTEKIAVDVSFRVERSGSHPGGFAQIAAALRRSGSTLAESTADLIDFILSVIPWLVLIIPAIWLIAKAWRRFRPKRPSPA